MHSTYDYDEKSYEVKMHLSLPTAPLCTSPCGVRASHEHGEGSDVGLLGKIFGKRDDDEGEEPTISLDLDARRAQLQRLEQALDALSRQMRELSSLDNPGWRGRVNEYSRLAGEAMAMRRGTPTREGVLDLVFEIRPVFTGPVPDGLASLAPLQDEVLRAANALRELEPGEKA